ncbi:hypothetical protein G6F56_012992 [Rhizopus delemar]|nr:hypothetical protein G6F56_012992 [Rhizopus delemar]
MSEIVLTNAYDYTNGSMMVDMDPGLKTTTDSNSNENSAPFEPYSSYQAYTAFPGYPNNNNNYPMSSRLGYFQDKLPTSPESSLSSTSPKDERFSTKARVKEMIDRANSVPMEFYHTEFLEYSKETYEKKMESKRNKRKRTTDQHQQNKKKKDDSDEDDDYLDCDEE